MLFSPTKNHVNDSYWFLFAYFNKIPLLHSIKGAVSDQIVPANDFKEFLDLNKITYAKAKRLKSKKDGRVLTIFQLEIGDPAEAEALLSQNLVCNVTGIVYKVEEFR